MPLSSVGRACGLPLDGVSVVHLWGAAFAASATTLCSFRVELGLMVRSFRAECTF